MTEPVFGVSDFVAVFNQTLETAYPSVIIAGELANFRVSKNRWVYFDLKDEYANVKFFGTVYNLPGPLEDGMLLEVRAVPKLHPQYGFSLTILSLQPTGEGSIKRAQALLQAKLDAEGLFDSSRKRQLPYAPEHVGLITSSESAGYADFVKIINERWGGVFIELADIQVQGEAAPAQIVRAIELFNEQAELPDVVVLIRGGGSAEDLAAFSTEQVTRAVAGSRVPTLVAIGHEIDLSLAELAADRRASTPSNAVQMLVPDKKEETVRLNSQGANLGHLLSSSVTGWQAGLEFQASEIGRLTDSYIARTNSNLLSKQDLLLALSPEAVLQRGYAIVRRNNQVIKKAAALKKGDDISLQFSDGKTKAIVQRTANRLI